VVPSSLSCRPSDLERRHDPPLEHGPIPKGATPVTAEFPQFPLLGHRVQGPRCRIHGRRPFPPPLPPPPIMPPAHDDRCRRPGRPSPVSEPWACSNAARASGWPFTSSRASINVTASSRPGKSSPNLCAIVKRTSALGSPSMRSTNGMFGSASSVASRIASPAHQRPPTRPIGLGSSAAWQAEAH
jgi:hypothetical protein